MSREFINRNKNQSASQQTRMLATRPFANQSTPQHTGMLATRPLAPPNQTPNVQKQSVEENASTDNNEGEEKTQRPRKTNLLEGISIRPPKPPSSPHFSIQTKLTLGAPGDKYEQEADQVAKQVVQRLNAPATVQPLQQQIIQRLDIPNGSSRMRKQSIQRLSDGNEMQASSELEAKIQRSRGGGQPLAGELRAKIENAFGANFSGVRVHTDSQSDLLNRSIQARAFTTGQDVFFRQGEYNPSNQGGQELLFHELTHVVQQNGGVRLQPKKKENPVLEKVKQYDEYIKEASKQYGISVEQIRSIIAVESRGKPEETSGAAWGLMQLTKQTWKGTQKARAELKDYDFETYWKDPKVNILFGTAALKAKMGAIKVQSDNPNFAKLAVVAYNAGEGTVKKAIALATKNGSTNPENDCLQPEYLKPAIKSTKIYSYYLTGAGYKINQHLKEVTADPNNKKKKIAVPKEGCTIEQAEEAAIELKYQEISQYPEKASSYMQLQSSSKNTGGANSSSNQSAKTTQSSANSNQPKKTKPSHYKIELKAWIPHSQVVDPEEPIRISNWLDTLSLPTKIVGLNYVYSSKYRGDNHVDYDGGYRVLVSTEFDYDGRAITGFSGKGVYGDSHRDWEANATIFGQKIYSKKDTETGIATSATFFSASATSFSLGMDSKNPLVMTFAPAINSNLKGVFDSSGQLNLKYNTDLFPSHGLRVYKDGSVIHTSVVNDASGVPGLGVTGAAQIGARLSSPLNNGTIPLPRLGLSP